MNKIFLNESIIKIRWVDIDMYSHLNNSKYFDFMLELRADFLDKYIMEFSSIRYILSDTRCVFKKEFKYPCNIIIKQYCISQSSASFELFYEFYDENRESIKAEGFAKMVCYDTEKSKPCKIPKPLFLKLSSNSFS